MIHLYSFPRVVLILTFFTFFFQAQATDTTKVLHLPEAIAAALGQNKDVRLARLDEQIAAAQYKESGAVFLPQARLAYSALHTNNSLNAFGFKLQQQGIRQSDFDPHLLNHPDGTPDFMTRVDVQQPLVNMDAVYQRKATQQQVLVYRYKAQRTGEYITLQVQQSYMQLQLAYQAVLVLEEALRSAQSLLTLTTNRFEQGLLQKSDVLNAHVHVAALETRREEARSSVRDASDALSLLMGTKPGTIYTTPPLVEVATPTVIDTVPASRADFEAMQQALAASDLVIKAGKMSLLPRLNAFGSYQWNDKAALDFGAPSYLAGLQLSWDLFKGVATKNHIATQRLERTKLAGQLESQQEQSAVALEKALRQWADTRFAIRQQQAAVASADEALRILQNRYTQGLVNTTDVLMAESQLAHQKLTYSEAVFRYNATAVYIEFLTASSK